MTRISTTLLVVACAAAVAGCSARLDEARRSAPADTAFDRALQTGYIELARAERDEIDFVDADVFAGRAISLANGERVVPERLDARKLPRAAAGDLAAARTRLMAALERGARVKAPEIAAEAQLRFDCWMQEQEENFQLDQIAACREGFVAALEKIELARPALARSRSPSLRPTPAAARASNAASRETKAFTVMFAFDSATIDGAGAAAIAKAVAAYNAAGAAIVRIAGHADRAGPEAYNTKLARARAAAVARAIERAGIPRGIIRTHSYGESRPAVATRDGQREDKNRRVEIGVDPKLPRTAVRQ